MQIPSELKYSSDHEWAKATGDVVRIGITDYAQDALGDVVFVDLLLAPFPFLSTSLAIGVLNSFRQDTLCTKESQDSLSHQKQGRKDVQVAKAL